MLKQGKAKKSLVDLGFYRVSCSRCERTLCYGRKGTKAFCSVCCTWNETTDKKVFEEELADAG